MPICPRPNRHNPECRSWRCGFHSGVVYGLLDERVNNIFYVGSTIQAPGKRYSQHLGANCRANFREAWILSILAAGSLPVFLNLGEFQTDCEGELKDIERAIARELRTLGHTAICDTTGRPELALYRNFCPITQYAEMYWSAYENAIAEYLDRVNEQAYIQRRLRDMYVI